MTASAYAPSLARRTVVREWFAAVGTIMVKELRSRMRGRRAFIVLTIYLALLALIAWGVYTIVGPAARQQAGFGGFNPGSANASAVVGQAIFATLSIFQLILVCFIAPAFTAGQISLEREKQTLDLLISTPMRPGAIVVGKLLAALAFVVLMIVAAIPISALVLMYGGAAVEDIVRQQIVLLATALVLGSIGLFYSSLLKRTQAATVLTYITVLALTLGTMMLFVFWTALVNQSGTGFGPPKRAPEQLLYVNPGVAILDVVGATESSYGQISSVLAQLRGDPNFGGGMVCQGDVCFPADQFGNPIVGGFEANSLLLGYWWPRIVLTFVGMSAIVTLLSIRLVIPAGMRFAFRGRRKVRAVAAAGTEDPLTSAAEGGPVEEGEGGTARPTPEAER